MHKQILLVRSFCRCNYLFSTSWFIPCSLVFAKHHSNYCMVLGILHIDLNGPIGEKSFLKLLFNIWQLIINLRYLKFVQGKHSKHRYQFEIPKRIVCRDELSVIIFLQMFWCFAKAIWKFWSSSAFSYCLLSSTTDI